MEENELRDRKAPEVGLGRRGAVPDLESLKTDTTCRRKFVSCSALFEFWFLGVMSSWHQSGPNALQRNTHSGKNVTVISHFFKPSVQF